MERITNNKRTNWVDSFVPIEDLAENLDKMKAVDRHSEDYLVYLEEYRRLVSGWMQSARQHIAELNAENAKLVATKDNPELHYELEYLKERNAELEKDCENYSEMSSECQYLSDENDALLKILTACKVLVKLVQLPDKDEGTEGLIKEYCGVIGALEGKYNECLAWHEDGGCPY